MRLLSRSPAEGLVDEEVRRNVLITTWNDMISDGEWLAAWGRRSSLWPLTSGLACCAIEMICAAAARFDIARFGAEMFRPSPRQADVMIVSGTVTKKMAPVIVRLFNQMPDPKYVISLGACANGGGPFKEGYNVVSGIDEFIPVDVYVRGCPPTPNALLQGLMTLQKMISSEKFLKKWRFSRKPAVPVPLLGPDLVDPRQASDIEAGGPRRDRGRGSAPKALPATRPAPRAADPSGGSAKAVAASLAGVLGDRKVEIFGPATLRVERASWPEAARHLRDALKYDYLANLSAADYADCFEVVAHLRSVGGDGQPLTVRVRTPRESPEVPSVTEVWPSAELQEREVYDLMGVRFSDHPDLRRILMWEGFAGHPLRKDWTEAYYEEPGKPFSTRWREGKYVRGEERSRWGRNVAYPEGWKPERGAAETAMPDGKPGLLLSIGPQHPSTHGVFQLKVRLDGERVVDLEPVFGYLHRCHDKIGERNTWLMNMPYTDRLDYFTSMSNNLAYAVAVERLAGLKVAERAEYIRVIMAELTRIVNHLLATGFLLNDLGTWFTPLLYCLEDRELILDLFESVSGSRMMCNYMRFSGISRDLPSSFLEEVRKLVTERLPRSLEAVDAYLTKNEIIRARLQGVGVLPRARAIAMGAAGPVLRASGVKYDLRKAVPYSIYDRFDFDVPTFPNGDSYDRYRIRVAEMWQSLRILEQALKQLPDAGPIIEKNQYLLRVPEGDAYTACENPKGELGFYLVSDGSGVPYRYHVRSPSFINLTPLAELCRGHYVADVVAILGSLDIIMGEVDR